MSRAEEDHSVEALRFQATEESFHVRVAIRASWGRDDRLHIRVFLKEITKRHEFGIAVNQKMRVVNEKPVLAIGQIAGHLSDPRAIRIGGDSRNMNPTSLEILDDENVHRDEPAESPD